jgi:hypothetical protein
MLTGTKLTEVESVVVTYKWMLIGTRFDEMVGRNRESISPDLLG